jgi:metallo-beta-lactamase class B
VRPFIAVLLFATSAFAQKDPVSRSWNEPVEPFRIHGNIYYVGASDITSFLITTPRGHILLDGGFEETAPMILANIRKLGFEPHDVKYLLSSHAHYDHAGGLAELKRATGATFVSSIEDLPAHARGGLDDPQFGNRFPYPPIEADRIIRDRATITVGSTTMTANITPGHTKGCTTWTLTVRDGGKTYNAVIIGSPNVNPGYKLVDNATYPTIAQDYERTFRVLESLTCDLFLGAHGAYFDMEAKYARRQAGSADAFVDPKGCAAFIAQKKQEFRSELAKQTAAKSKS